MFGLNESTVMDERQERKDNAFRLKVEEWLGRALTEDEGEEALEIRDQNDYTNEEVATELLARSAN